MGKMSSSKGKKSSQRAEELRKDIPIEEHMWDVDKVLSHYRVSSSVQFLASIWNVVGHFRHLQLCL